MSTDERFIELWNDHLEGELDETGTTELRRLLAQDDRLVQMAADSYRTHRLLRLVAQDSESQQDDFVQQTLNRLPAEDDLFVGAVMRQVPRGRTATTRPRTRSLDTWRWIMRSPVSRAAAATILVLAITGVAFWFHGGGTTSAFADFVAPILEAKNIKFKTTTETKGQPPMRGETMVIPPARMRNEMEMSDKSKMVMIWDWDQGKALCLTTAAKHATVLDFASMPKDNVPKNSFREFLSLLLDARGDKPDFKREPLGEKEIDGRHVVGYRLTRGGEVYNFWGDPKTGQPALIEQTMTMFPNTTTTMSDFVFNVDMDESLFSVEPPAGYTVENMEVDVSPAEEKDLIETFRIYSELSDGVFPDSLVVQPTMQTAAKMVRMKNALEVICEKLAPEKGKLDAEQRQEFEDLMRTIKDFGFAPGKEKPSEERMVEIEVQMYKFKAQMLKADWGKVAPGQEKPTEEEIHAEVRKMAEAGMKKFMEVQMPLQRGLFFVFTLPPEADMHYAGKGVSFGAADTPIFWHRPKDSKKYRVIYADLSVREADTPPSVPNAQPVPAPSSPKE